MEARPDFSAKSKTNTTRTSRLSALATGSPVKGGTGGWADDDFDLDI